MSVSQNQIEAIAGVLFRPSGCDGVYARTALFEQVMEGLLTLISRFREPDTEILAFPPVMSRQQLERSGYLLSFPHLLGCVSSLQGEEAEVRAAVEGGNGNWFNALSPTDVVLSPAACYPIYPMVAAREAVPANGLLFDVSSYCYRRETTHELDRLQAFRMREYVFVGTGDQALQFRARWLPRGEELASGLGLSYKLDKASDPFFGRAGRLAALIQVEQELKFELLIPVHSAEQPTACMSFNYHQDHFGSKWNLRTESGDVARTACIAFGLDRLVLALFVAHGLDPKKWPATTRKALSL